MKEYGIIFKPESARAILAGAKTQTRRLIKFPKHVFPKHIIETPGVIYEDGGGNWIAWDSDAYGLGEFTKRAYPNGEGFPCPYGRAGDRQWVRESAYIAPPNFVESRSDLNNRVDDEGRPRVVSWVSSMDTEGMRCAQEYGVKKTSPRFMPRWASQLIIEITNVRPVRLQTITEQEALSEGIRISGRDVFVGREGPGRLITPWPTAVEAFADKWDEINYEKGPWKSNPWVWVITFKQIAGPQLPDRVLEEKSRAGSKADNRAGLQQIL